MPAKPKSWLRRNLLLALILSGVVVGGGLGLSLRSFEISERWALILAYPGEMLMRAFQCFILPLIITSFISGAATLNASLNGKIALRTVSFFAAMTVVNAIMGITLAILIHPGTVYEGNEERIQQDEDVKKPDIFDSMMDLGRNILPNNIVSASFQQSFTAYEKVDGEFVRKTLKREGTNTLGIIVYCLVVGTLLGKIGDRAKPLIDSIRVLDDVNLRTLKGLMFLSPIGVASIICTKIKTITNLAFIMTRLGLFVMTIFIGIFLYHLVLVQLLYFLIKRKNPFTFYFGMMPAIITAFSTASSAMTLPVTLTCLEELGIRKRVSHFVVPLGVQINKHGTSMFIGATCVFLAQMSGLSLGIGDYVNYVFVATSISLAAAGSPSAALALVIGIPMTEVALLFTIDWLLDRGRTTNNVLGDAYACLFVDHFSKEELELDDACNTSADKETILP